MTFKAIATCLLLLASAAPGLAQALPSGSGTNMDSGNQVTVRFVNLSYAEGRIFVAVNDGDKMLEGNVVTVEGDKAEVTLPLHKYDGQKVLLRAFQDLDDSGNIEFDELGRPVEPVLQQAIEVTPDLKSLDVELISYL